MTSKNCFSKMLVRDLKERGVWLISSIILFLLIYPVQILMSLDAIASYMKGEEEFQSRITEQFSSLISFGNGIMYVAIVIMAFLLAMSGFWYVYSGVKTDFYHSLPIKREKLFLERYVTGILIFIVPYFISLILGYGAGIMKGAETSGILSLCAKGFVTNFVLFLLFYNLAVLGVLLTGNLFTGVLAYGAFLSYGVLLESTIGLTKVAFFTTYIDNSRLSQVFEGKLGKLSPLYVFDMILSNNKISMKDVSVVFGISVLFLVICMFVYKIRPTEAYHKSIAFKKLQPIIKVAVVIPVSACVGILSSEIVGRNFIWYVGGLLVTAVLLSFAMEFLYYLDIRECIRPKISTGLILGMLVIMAVTLKLDLIGFDTYLPKESRVKNMSIYIDGLNSCYDYPEGAGEMYGTVPFLQNTKIEEFDAIYQLAKKAVAIQKADKVTADSEITDSEELYFSVCYEMKNGKEVYRGYCIPKDEENLKLIADIYDKGISVGSMSKTYSLPGLRVGWITSAREDLINEINHQRQYNTISISALDDYFAAIALEQKDCIAERNFKIMQNGLSILKNWLDTTPKVRCILPKGGTTVLLKYNVNVPSREFCRDVQKTTGVALLPGETLEMEGYVRAGFCAENLTPALQKLGEYLNNFRYQNQRFEKA